MVRDAAFDYLAEAESVLLMAPTDCVTDEAFLLRGCLSALVAIARMKYDEGCPQCEVMGTCPRHMKA